MLRILLYMLLFGCSIHTVLGQEDKLSQKHGVLKGTAGIEPGYMFQPQLLTVYISGNLEYYLQERVSVRGDGYFFINTAGENATLMANHAVYFGAAYHFTNKTMVDPYVGFQPGVQLVRLRYWDVNDLSLHESKFKPVPVASLIGGANFYVSRFFNFYVATRGVFGRYMGGGAPDPLSLNEWRVSFGLGFNIGLLKKK